MVVIVYILCLECLFWSLVTAHWGNVRILIVPTFDLSFPFSAVVLLYRQFSMSVPFPLFFFLSIFVCFLFYSTFAFFSSIHLHFWFVSWSPPRTCTLVFWALFRFSSRVLAFIRVHFVPSVFFWFCRVRVPQVIAPLSNGCVRVCLSSRPYCRLQRTSSHT